MKQCVICEEDCSNRPRTKDRQGRYYCQTCHDEALARKEKVHHATTLMEMPEEPSVLDDILGGGSAAPPPPPPPGGRSDAMGLEPAAPKAPPTILSQPARFEKPKAGRKWSIIIPILGFAFTGFVVLICVSILNGTWVPGGQARGIATNTAPISTTTKVALWVQLAVTSLLFFGSLAALFRRAVAEPLIRSWAGLIVIIAVIAGFGSLASVISGRGSGVAFAGVGFRFLVSLIPALVAYNILRRDSFKEEIGSWS